MTRIYIVIAAGLALAATLPAAPAQAAGRTFVSTAGSDSNPCSITLPCRNLQAAYNAVAANGQVDVLDPGNYGSLTIIGPVSIQGHGWAGMSTNIGAAITINAAGATDKIAISGVVLDGLGIANTNGIVFNSGGSLTVADSVMRNFSSGGSATGNGILLQPTSGAVSFVIINSIFSNNGNSGIVYRPLSGTATANGVIDHVVATNNQGGISIDTTIGGGSTTVAISNGIASNNSGGIGILNGSASLAVSIDNMGITGNINGMGASNTAKVLLSRSVITDNTDNGIENSTTPNTFYTYGNNQINLNATDILGTLNTTFTPR